MYLLSGLLSLISIILLIVGLFSPRKSLFWFNGQRTRTRSFIIYMLSFLAFSFLTGRFEPPKSASSNTETLKDRKADKPKIEILQMQEKNDPSIDVTTIYCRVKNNSNKLVTYLDLKATFFDKNGKIVGTGLGNAANFASGTERTIDVLALQIQGASKYEVVVENVIYE